MNSSREPNLYVSEPHNSCSPLLIFTQDITSCITQTRTHWLARLNNSANRETNNFSSFPWSLKLSFVQEKLTSTLDDSVSCNKGSQTIKVNVHCPSPTLQCHGCCQRRNRSAFLVPSDMSSLQLFRRTVRFGGTKSRLSALWGLTRKTYLCNPVERKSIPERIEMVFLIAASVVKKVIQA